MASTVGIDGHDGALEAVAVRGRRHAAADPAALPRHAVVAAGLSPRAAVTLWLTAPFGNRRKALRVAPALLDVELPFPLEDCVWTVAAERAVPGGREMLAVAARQADIRRRLDELAAAGIDPQVLDHEGLALWSQSMETCPVDAAEQYRAVCHIHAEGVTLVFGEGDCLRGVYTVPAVGRAQFERLFVARFGRDWRTRSDPPGSIVMLVCGPRAADHAGLCEELGLPASVRCVVPDEPERFLALGLAMRAARPGTRFACNLRRGPLAHPDRLRRERRGLCLALMGLALAGLVAGAGGIVARRISRLRLDGVNRAIATEATRLAGYPVLSRGSDAVEEARRAVIERLGPEAAFRQQLAPSLLHVLQRVMTGVTAGGGMLERLSCGLDGDVGLVMRVPDAEAMSRVVADWADAGLVPVAPPSVRTTDTGMTVELTLAREVP